MSFPPVMVVWCIKNNDISTASLHFKLFKTPYSYIGLISADIASFSTNYDQTFFRKIVNREVRRRDNSVYIFIRIGQTHHTVGTIKTVGDLGQSFNMTVS